MTRYWTQAPTIRVQSLSPWIRRDVPECHFMDTSNYEYLFLLHSTCGASGKEPTSLCRRHKGLRFNPWVRKVLWSRKWQPTLVSLPGASPWAEEPGGLQSIMSQSVRHDWVTERTTTFKTINGHILCTMFYGILLIFSWQYLGDYSLLGHYFPQISPVTRWCTIIRFTGPHWNKH